MSSSKSTSSTLPSTGTQGKGSQGTWPKSDSRRWRIWKRLCSTESSKTMRLGLAAAIALTKADPMYPPAPVTRTDCPAWADENGTLRASSACAGRKRVHAGVSEGARSAMLGCREIALGFIRDDRDDGVGHQPGV